MQIDLSCSAKPEAKRIYVIGSGFTCDTFHPGVINPKKDIVIATNAGAALVSGKIDYYIASNWFSLRDSIAKHISSSTTVVIYSGLSGSPTVLVDEFVRKGPINKHFFGRLTKLLLSRRPVVLDYRLDSKILKEPCDFCSLVENEQYLPADTGSGPPSIALAMYLTEKMDIEEIVYVGFDFLRIRTPGQRSRELAYPLTLKDTMAWNSAIHCVPSVDVYRKLQAGFVQWLYKHQLSACMILASMSEDFYNASRSHSVMDFKDFTFQQLEEKRQELVKHLEGKKRNKPAAEDYDWFYNQLYGSRDIGSWMIDRIRQLTKDTPDCPAARITKGARVNNILHVPETTQSKKTNSRTTSTKKPENTPVADPTAACKKGEKVLVCRRWGGVGDHYLLNMVWPIVLQEGVIYDFITPKRYHSIHRHAGFRRLIDFVHTGLKERDNVVNNKQSMNLLVGTLEEKFPEYDRYVDVSHMCGITEHQLELEKLGRIHSDRVHTWARCFGVEAPMKKLSSYKVEPAERREARKIIDSIVAGTKGRGPVLGYAPKGSNDWTLAPNYKEIGTALANAGFTVVILHDTSLKIPGCHNITQQLDFRMMFALVAELDLIYTINTSWHIAAMMLDIPSVVDFKWGATTQYARYNQYGEYLYPSNTPKLYCGGCESRPAHELWHPKICWSGKPHKSVINCQHTDIKQIVQACKTVSRNRRYALSSPIGLIIDSPKYAKAVACVESIYKDRELHVIVTHPDKTTRKAAANKCRALGRNVRHIIEMPTEDGNMDESMLHYLRKNRAHIHFEAKYLQLEMGSSGRI